MVNIPWEITDCSFFLCALLTTPGVDTSTANSITAKQAASLSKIKSKIQNTSPQRARPTQPSQKVRDSEEFSQALPEPSGAALDNHEVQDELKEPKIKRDQDSPDESEPDVLLSPSGVWLPYKGLLPHA